MNFPYRLFSNISQLFFILFFALIPFSQVAHAAADVSEVQRISVPPASIAETNGTQANSSSTAGDISPDGRYTVFLSNASNLVLSDTNALNDVFVYDHQTGTIDRVSIAADGTEGNHDTIAATISNDGRYVAMRSSADNLAAGGTTPDFLYIYDRQMHTMQHLVDNVIDTPVIAGSGGYIVFASANAGLVAGDTNGVADVFVYNLQTNTVERDSIATDGTQGDGQSYTPSISSDGRYVVFASDATNLVSGDTNGFTDIFVRDRQLNTTKRVSIASDGTQGNWIAGEQPVISDDGRYVAFTSDASNLVSGDTNNVADTFVYDIQSSTITRVSIANDGTEADDYSFSPSITADGHYVAFNSAATTLVPNDVNGVSDLFVYNQTTHTLARVSTAADDTEGDDYSLGYIAGDGNWVTYESRATALVAEDTNGVSDIFIAQLTHPGPTLSSIHATAADTTATITWNTDVNSSTLVTYGLTTAYGSTATGTDSVMSHSVSLSSLLACTTYHYTVSSVDADSLNTTSTDNTFTTTGCQSAGGGGSSGGSSSSSHHSSSSHDTATDESNPTVPPPIPPATNPACTTSAAIMPKGTLTKGMVSMIVGVAQRFLHDYGYYAGVIDNDFGPKTEAAVKAFQETQKLPVTGVWDEATGKAADMVLQCNTQQPLPTTPTLPVPSASTYTFTHDLHLAMTDPDVLKLQQYLNAHGALVSASGAGAVGSETAYFGARTKAALAMFQRAHNISPASGFFGPITRGYVNTQ